MSRTRQKIEGFFEALAVILFERPLTALIVIGLMVGALALALPRLELDTSSEGMLHTSDPIISLYEEFQDQFGRDSAIVIALKPAKVFETKFLDFLTDLHQELEHKTPYLEDITSLINARETRAEGDTLIVDELLAAYRPGDKLGHAQLAALKKRVIANPLYVDQLISADGRMVTLILRLVTDAPAAGQTQEDDELAGFEDDASQNSETGQAAELESLSNAQQVEAVEAVEAVLSGRRGQGVEIYLAGPPVVGKVLEQTMVKDLYTSVFSVLGVVTLCLAFMFRRLSGVLLPQLIVNLSMAATLGLMAWLGVAVKLPSMILPAFLLAVAVGASIHILALFYRHLASHGDKKAAVVFALGRSGLAVTMTSLTTAGGLASFATASVAPIAEMGIFAAAGVMIALVLTIIILPALLSLTPIRQKKSRQASPAVRLDAMLSAIAAFSVRRAKIITVTGLVIIALSALGAAQLKFSHNVLAWLPQSLAVRQDTEVVDRELKGTVNVEVVIDTGRENGLHEPKILTALDRLARRLEAEPTGGVQVGKGVSLADLVKEIHQALNEDRAEAYRIPTDRALIAQELLLFENSGSDDLKDLVDSRFQKARLTARVPWGDAVIYAPFLDELKEMFAAEMGPGVKVTVTGVMTLFFRTIRASIVSMARSYIIALVVITLMMIMLIGQIKTGLLAMIPNLAPIVLTLGLMGWLGFPLDMITMLTGSIAIGLAVDDTVHFMHHFRRYYLETGDVASSVDSTLRLAGRAMMVTTIVLSLGFFILMTATLNSVNRFGFLTGVTVILALAADFLLAPALMTLAYGSKGKTQEKAVNS